MRFTYEYDKNTNRVSYLQLVVNDARVARHDQRSAAAARRDAKRRALEEKKLKAKAKAAKFGVVLRGSASHFSKEAAYEQTPNINAQTAEQPFALWASYPDPHHSFVLRNLGRQVYGANWKR
jgi:hypothetical protein